jgi:cytochrome c biogenesis protein CcmG/thiol:disulfide interchange protein DsbE
LPAALASISCGAGAPPRSAPSAVLDKPLPRLQGRALDGASVDTSATAGKVVVVKFFAKYCEPCLKTLPATQRLHEKHREVAFIGVSEDESRADVEELVRTFRLSFPVVHDAGNGIAGRFRVSELPATFVADGRGTIRWVGGDKQTEDDLARAIEWARGLPE